MAWPLVSAEAEQLVMAAEERQVEVTGASSVDLEYELMECRKTQWSAPVRSQRFEMQQSSVVADS